MLSIGAYLRQDKSRFGLHRMMQWGLLLLILCIMPGLLIADQRNNPWSLPDASQGPIGARPWGNTPSVQQFRQPVIRQHPPAPQSYYPPVYPGQAYSGTPYIDPYMGMYRDPYLTPGYGAINGVYPGLYGRPAGPGIMPFYPMW